MCSRNKIIVILSVLIIAALLSYILFVKKTQNPKIIMSTQYGNIEIELYVKQAPITANNFIRYIKEHRVKNPTFYRAVTLNNQSKNNIKIEVIQGGLLDENDPKNLPPIPLETTAKTNLHHLDGTISMARDGPNTATSQFFICIGVQPQLDYGGKRNPDGQGFAAFGRVVKGMNIVRKIQNLPAKGQYLTHPVKIVAVKLLTTNTGLLHKIDNWILHEVSRRDLTT